MLGEDGIPDPSRSRWFSIEIDKQNFPWFFSRGEKASRVIATLESLAVLLALKAFYGSGPREARQKVRLQPTWTDNRGNGAALNKLMSTHYPINAVLMELAVHCKRTGIVPTVNWAPRLFNREADDLANGRTQAFSPSLEVKMNPSELQWHILPQVLLMGQEADEAYRISTAAGTIPDRGLKASRRKPEERLKLKNPW